MSDEKRNEKPQPATLAVATERLSDLSEGEIINPSGHRQEVERNFGIWSICGAGITTGSDWPAIGGSLVVALYNGGPPGVVYEFMAVSVCYWFVAAAIAELASAMPSSGGVYAWASVTAGPKYGRSCSFFAGWWNFFAWIFGSASMSSICSNAILACYALFHPDYEQKKWHVFVLYLVLTWICCGVVMFGNRALPMIQNIGTFVTVVGVFVTIMVCAIMPHRTGAGYASNAFVWREWDNDTGYSSNGFVFLAGMLNGAYSVGTPDCVTHLAEEIPHPRVNIPKAILAQMIVGAVTALTYLIAIFYAISSLPDILNTTSSFPIAAVYFQATGSNGGALGLLVVIFLPLLGTLIGTYITSGRILWTLARDDATPFSKILGSVHPQMKNQLNATLACGIIVTILGCIYLGSSTAFNAFVGSFVVLSTLSYLSAILPALLTRRRHIVAGPFYMPGIFGEAVYAISSAFIVTFIVIFCFPYGVPVMASTMNYTSVIAAGLTVIIAAMWAWKRTRGYVGPQVLLIHAEVPDAEGDTVRADVI